MDLIEEHGTYTDSNLIVHAHNGYWAGFPTGEEGE